MSEGWDAATLHELGHLRRLTSALGDALSVDDVARAALGTGLALPGVVRVGLALKQTGGRQLRYLAADQDGLAEGHGTWCVIDAYADVPVVASAREGNEIYLQRLADVEEQFPEILERQRDLGARSLATLPLVTEEEPIGALLLSYASERYFSSQDRWFLRSFAAQVAQAVRRGLAYQVQSMTSEQLQRSLMPHSLPELEGLTLGAHYAPGGLNVDVGGDWYDVVQLGDGSVVFALGDVMGKGVPAAIVMSEVRSALRAYALIDPRPAVVLSRLDALVDTLAVPAQIVTMVYGVLSPDLRTVTYAVAGHPPPLLVPHAGEPTVLRDRVGPALGLGAGPWPETRFALDPDVTLLLYSDGLVESRDVDLFAGIEALARRISELPARRRNAREMCSRISGLMHQRDTDDDVTVLAISATVPAETLTAGVELPGDTTASSRARRFVRSTLEAWAVDGDAVDTAELCVSELVTNAIIHSGTSPEVVVRVEANLLTVLVQDRGGRGTVHQVEDFDPLSVSGRGLTLVDALATAWSAEHSADGTTVWFELELADSAAMHANAG
jgi:serine phosphatase RsbU (regulator of sigma subunit)/anti-sigma regulatory factor (Ser/Thr protein kinase)